MRLPSMTAILLAATGLAAADIPTRRPCGLKIAPCGPGTHCIPNKSDCTNLDRCLGHCVSNNDFPICGGYPSIAKRCTAGYECRQDPRDPPGIADKPGICLLKGYQGLRLCGGIADGDCPAPEKCYDMPWDDCDPNRGGSDCRGICL
ncbi:unnamed protein product [Clonostachys solani]|uniref:Uncharacterized protein n=1 Tax=Clonostachys solani TaxID=160281 RepID=A0A9N9W3J8_9HYPO|nr:unnamed protein product [Clonostachys solani]